MGGSDAKKTMRRNYEPERSSEQLQSESFANLLASVKASDAVPRTSAHRHFDAQPEYETNRPVIEHCCYERTKVDAQHKDLACPHLACTVQRTLNTLLPGGPTLETPAPRVQSVLYHIKCCAD